MFFAENYCKCVESISPEHTFTYTGKCQITGKEVSVTVKANELFDYRLGRLIQDAFPSLTSGQREFLISGFSDEGWDQTFKEDEEEDEESTKVS